MFTFFTIVFAIVWAVVIANSSLRGLGQYRPDRSFLSQRAISGTAPRRGDHLPHHLDVPGAGFG